MRSFVITAAPARQKLNALQAERGSEGSECQQRPSRSRPLQVETGNAAVFAVMWDSPETPAAENPEVTPEAEPSEEPAEDPDAEPTEAPAENPDVVEEPAEDIASPDEVPAADENGETSLIEVLGDDTNLRVSPSIEAEVLATVNAGTQLTLLDTVTAEDGATWYKVSWEGTEAYIRSDMAQVVDSSDEEKSLRMFRKKKFSLRSPDMITRVTKSMSRLLLPIRQTFRTTQSFP